jgi:hypothetical protein
MNSNLEIVLSISSDYSLLLKRFSNISLPETYEECVIAKTQQNVIKKWSGSSNVRGEHFYMDITSIKKRSFGGAKVWALIFNVLEKTKDVQGKVITLLAELKLASKIEMCARLIACSYNQVQGTDLNEIFANMLNDASFRIMLVAKFVWNLTSILMYEAMDFLHSDVDEEISMELSIGLSLSVERN